MPRTPKGHRHVAILLNGSYSTNAELLEGILQYARTQPAWATDIRLGRRGENMVPDLSTGGVDGVIADACFLPPTLSACPSRIPVIVQDPNPATLRIPNVVAHIDCDNATVARRAVGHLRGCKLSHYGFVPEPSGQAWSKERLRAFRRELRDLPKGAVHVYDPVRQTLKQWLLSLPRPVGIFAADDIRSRQTADAVHEIGARIPEDYAIVGVDNDKTLCETGSPALSSVWMTTRAAGYRAAETLDGFMGGRRMFPKRPIPIRYGGEVVPRLSTRLVATGDPLIAKCRALLESHCERPLSLADILPELHVSRRTLEMRFKAATGHTVHDELLNLRISRAKALLVGSDLPQSAIAESCGFHDASHLNAVFRRKLGVLPSHFKPTKPDSAIHFSS